MNEILQNLFKAAATHGAATTLEIAVEDLQGLLLRAWNIMNVSQKYQMLRSPEVEALLKAGTLNEVKPEELVLALDKALAEIRAKVTKEGYVVLSNQHHDGSTTYFWKDEDDASEDFDDINDCLVDAIQHITLKATNTAQ